MTAANDNNANLVSLPVEVLVKIFIYLDSSTLDNIETISNIFKDVIDSSVKIWRQKIRSFCHSNSQLKTNLNYTSYAESRRCAKSLRNFYQKLIKLQKNFSLGEPGCNKHVLDCLGATLNDRKVVKNPEWSRNHNFRGVMIFRGDMILDEGRICASIYDTIQIWNTLDLRITHLFTNDILDLDKTKTTCFTLCKDLLLCGTDNGYLKVLDIKTEEIITKARINSNSLSDVKCKDEIIITLDWFGNIVFWKLENNLLHQVMVQNTDSFTVPHILRQRDMERLMDSNSRHLITIFKSHISVYSFGVDSKEGFRISFPVYTDVFCIHLLEDFIAFGCKGTPRHEGSSFIHPVAGIASLKHSPPRVYYLRTQYNDPVISIHLTDSHIILGDVNGEIHVISIQNLQFYHVEKFTDLEEENDEFKLVYTLRSHAYRDFIWALKFDGFRLYSGDETGKIIVHDFLNPPEKSTIQNIEDKTIEQENKSSNETADNVEDLNKNEDLINKAKKPKLNTNDM